MGTKIGTDKNLKFNFTVAPCKTVIFLNSPGVDDLKLIIPAGYYEGITKVRRYITHLTISKLILGHPDDIKKSAPGRPRRRRASGKMKQHQPGRIFMERPKGYPQFFYL